MADCRVGSALPGCATRLQSGRACISTVRRSAILPTPGNTLATAKIPFLVRQSSTAHSSAINESGRASRIGEPLDGGDLGAVDGADRRDEGAVQAPHCAIPQPN
jgi:hypothetical protein